MVDGFRSNRYTSDNFDHRPPGGGYGNVGMGTYRNHYNYHVIDKELFYVGTDQLDTTTVPSNETILKPSDGATDDEFGRAVAVGGKKIVVSAYGYNNYQGKIYIYDLDGTNEIIITNPITGQGRFGYDVAIGDGRIVVSAPFDGNGGIAYLYDLEGNLVETLNPTVGAGEGFGTSVDIGCGRIVVGSPYYSSNKGRAFIFDLNGVEIREFFDHFSGQMGGEQFGRAVAIGCGKIIVGSPEYDYSYSGFFGTGKGIAQLYDLSGNKLRNIYYSGSLSSNFYAGGDFGENLAIGDGRIVAGLWNGGYHKCTVYDLDGNAKVNFDATNFAIGCGRLILALTDDDTVYVRSLDDSANGVGSLLETLPLTWTPGNSDSFGSSVAVGDGVIVVGNRLDDDNGSNSGSAFIYTTPDQTHFLDLISKR